MSFIAARLQAGHTPPIVELPLAAAYAGNAGALVLKDGSNNIAECGADPAVIFGVAQSAGGADTGGYGGHGTKEFPPGYMGVVKAANEQQFHAKYVGTLPAADGGSYGVVRDTDGLWKVDFAEITATRVKLVGRLTGSPENRDRVLVVFLAANVQL